jgi:hypothetical protein
MVNLPKPPQIRAVPDACAQVKRHAAYLTSIFFRIHNCGLSTPNLLLPV